MTDIPSRLAAALADRYRVERELGRGGMATVYMAQDNRHDRKVALKLRPRTCGAEATGTSMPRLMEAALRS